MNRVKQDFRQFRQTPTRGLPPRLGRAEHEFAVDFVEFVVQRERQHVGRTVRVVEIPVQSPHRDVTDDHDREDRRTTPQGRGSGDHGFPEQPHEPSARTWEATNEHPHFGLGTQDPGSPDSSASSASYAFTMRTTSGWRTMSSFSSSTTPM